MGESYFYYVCVVNVLYLHNVCKKYNHKLIGFYHEIVVEDLAALACSCVPP